MLTNAIREELLQYLQDNAARLTDDGRPAVVRNDYHKQREFLTPLGNLAVQVPKVRSRADKQAVFHSSLVPPYFRRSQTLDVALPWHYLHGVSTGQMAETLSALVGELQYRNLSPAVVSRLKKQWEKQYRAWRQRPPHNEKYVHLWADGIYCRPRGDKQMLCLLVVIGVPDKGEKHFLAIEDGQRESKASWREVLYDLQRRGLNNPRLAVVDGALGFCAAMAELFPKTATQRCWVHKTRNVLIYLAKVMQARAKTAWLQIWMAPSRAAALQAVEIFVRMYGAKYPRAVASLKMDLDKLLTFYNFPAEHWVSLRTTNPI